MHVASTSTFAGLKCLGANAATSCAIKRIEVAPNPAPSTSCRRVVTGLFIGILMFSLLGAVRRGFLRCKGVGVSICLKHDVHFL